MRVLLICSFYDNFVEQLYVYVNKYYSDVDFSILTSKRFSEDYIRLAGDKVYFPDKDNYMGYMRLFANMPEFDIAHMLWIEPIWGIYISYIAKRTDSVYISVGGSDLYRDSNSRIIRILQKRILSYADCVSSENTQTRDFFEKRYGRKCAKLPHYIARFGIDVLENIDKVCANSTKKQIREKWGINNGKYVVMLGHNGRRQHNHFEMIDALSQMEADEKDQLYVIIPMTYGAPNKEYISEVEERIKNTGVEYTVIREYMDNDRMAELAIVTDIMIHVQDTDQLSSTMLSCIYAGSVVIAGSWLPYDSLKDAGIFFLTVDNHKELTRKLSDTLKNECYESNCKTNSDRVNELSSWKNSAKVWHDIYMHLDGIQRDEE